MPLTTDEIQMLAALTSRCRPHGATTWDPPGIAAAIRKVANRPLPSVMRACAAAAADRNNRTPGIIPQAGAHWRDDTGMPLMAPPLADLCRDCGTEQGPSHPPDHPWVSLKGAPVTPGYGSDAARQARELVAQARKAGEPSRVAARRPVVQTGVAKTPSTGAGSES